MQSMTLCCSLYVEESLNKSWKQLCEDNLRLQFNGVQVMVPLYEMICQITWFMWNNDALHLTHISIHIYNKLKANLRMDRPVFEMQSTKIVNAIHLLGFFCVCV